MPSRRHQLLAWAVPRVRKAGEIESPAIERARLEQLHASGPRALPTQLVRGFEKRFGVVTEVLTGAGGDFASYVITPRGTEPRRTILYLHGGGYVSGIDPNHVRYATRLAEELGARVVLPDYPLAPEHTWRDSHPVVADLATRWAEDSDQLVIAGDSAGGGYALALALTLRDRGGVQPSHLVLHSPWVDLTTSTPETAEFSARDPWLFLGKLEAYAAWWAGSPDDLGRPEVSPALGDLDGLPPALMFCGTRDTLAPGCRLLERRAQETDWDVTYIEVADLIHVYPILPLIPEADDAWARTVEFLR